MVAVAAVVAAAGLLTDRVLANAQTIGFDSISIDMESAGNTADSLGSRQECREALPGATVTIDITVEGISAANPMIGYSATFRFAGPALAVTKQEQIKLRSGDGSQLFNSSDPLPDFDGMWSASAVDIGQGPVVHETGSGVLERLELEVSTDAAPAVYNLVLSEVVIIDPDNETHSPPVTRNARLAIGVSCSGSTPLPVVTASATPIATGQTDVPGDSTTPGVETPSPGGSLAPGSETAGATSASGSPIRGSYTAPSPSATTTGEDDGGGSSGWIALVAAIVVLALVAGGWLAFRRRADG